MDELYQLTLKYKNELKCLDDHILFESVNPNIGEGIKYLFRIDELQNTMKVIEFYYNNDILVNEQLLSEFKLKLTIGEKIKTIKLFF